MRAVFWVDGPRMSTNDEATADWWMQTLFERFDGHEVSPDTFLGLQIDYDRVAGRLKMHRTNYVQELLRNYQMEASNPTATPMEPHTQLLAEDRPATPDLPRRERYQELVGLLQYLSQWTRPELGFVCSQLAKHLSNPGKVHWTAAVRVLGHIRPRASPTRAEPRTATPRRAVSTPIGPPTQTCVAASAATCLRSSGGLCCGRPSSRTASINCRRRASSWRQARPPSRPSGYVASSRAVEHRSPAPLPSTRTTARANSCQSHQRTGRGASRSIFASTRSRNKSRTASFDSSRAPPRAWRLTCSPNPSRDPSASSTGKFSTVTRYRQLRGPYELRRRSSTEQARLVNCGGSLSFSPPIREQAVVAFELNSLSMQKGEKNAKQSPFPHTFNALSPRTRIDLSGQS